MIRRPPRSTLDRSSAASDVYKRQYLDGELVRTLSTDVAVGAGANVVIISNVYRPHEPVSYTHLRAHETVLDFVCRLLLEKKTQDTARRWPTHVPVPECVHGTRVDSHDYKNAYD